MAKLLAPTTIGDKRMLHVYLDVGDIGSTTRYYKLANIDRNNGIIQINGLLAGRNASHGRSLINIAISFKDGLSVWGIVSGRIEASDIRIFTPADTSNPPIEVWAVVKSFSLVNLELSAVGNAEIVYDGTFTTTLTGTGEVNFLSNVQNTGIVRFPNVEIGGFNNYIITPTYTFGSGISVVNSTNFTLRVLADYLSNSVLKLFILPTITNILPAGFLGEGLINLNVDLSNALDRLGAKETNHPIDPYVGAALVPYSKYVSTSLDHNYFINGLSWDPSPRVLTISLYRTMFTSNDSASLPTGMVLVKFY